MKFSVFLGAVLAITSAEACASYKYCWCVRDNFNYQGKVQNNIAWDEDTTKACVANGGGGVSGWYGQNFKECYRYVKRTIRLDGAINNCDFSEQCAAAGKAEGVTSRGLCRDKISGFHWRRTDV
ncbi:hypothetical protein CCHL11_09180 [Colletotrichum chlorophyti]|uniref:Uncharacterized protein n=1 Tax=Colletotrichum chlorophyti TaxID=708187 RepID=A0A1Q8S8K8_9PEZI|nr:hypothetical protein CCHL11_09180 [Colletotrichum chlorophyti]